MPDNTEDNKPKDYRTFLSLGSMGPKLENYQETDPRFSTRSACAIHLIELGMEADKKAREKAISGVST